jgi:plastocyanin
VPLGNAIEWTNDDDVSHTVTSSADAGATFDSGLMAAGDVYRLDTAKLEPGTYDYLCIVHPWMIASFVLGGSESERLADGATVTDPNSIPPEETPEHSGAVSIETEMEETIEAPVEETEPSEKSNVMEGEVIVSIPAGVSTPGCEQTDECFSPSSITVSIGSTIVWTNDDTAAHTVTSGIDTTPDGIFDSGLFMAGKTFSYKFEVAGEYPYYCLVHPWMIGTVTVE